MKLIVTVISIFTLTACQSTATKEKTTIEADNSNANLTTEEVSTISTTKTILIGRKLSMKLIILGLILKMQLMIR